MDTLKSDMNQNIEDIGLGLKQKHTSIKVYNFVPLNTITCVDIGILRNGTEPFEQ